MAESSDKPYRVEYAKSGRASCKKCKESIPKDSIRMAFMVQVRAEGALCARPGLRASEEGGGRAGPEPWAWPTAPSQRGACGHSCYRGTSPPGGPVFRQVLLILQEKPGKYGLEPVGPFTL